MNKAVTIIAAALALASPAALISAPDLDGTRATLEQWVQLRKLISEEKSKWAVEEETLNESIDLLKKEIEDLRTLTTAKQDDATEAEKQRSLLTEQENALKDASAAVRKVMADIESQTLALLPKFPDILQEKLDVITVRIPKDQKTAAKLSLSQRMQYVAGVLGEIEKFNNQLSISNTIDEINGQRVEVKVLYLGLAVGYYVDGTRSTAGTLRPGPEGWVKEPNNALAENIAQAVALFEREDTAARFISLPITIQ